MYRSRWPTKRKGKYDFRFRNYHTRPAMGIIENAKRVIGLIEEKNCKKLDIAISDLIVAPYYEEREKNKLIASQEDFDVF